MNSLGEEYDVCIVGSGAGAGPVAYELSKAGKSVLILEKGKWYSEKDFSKDEIKTCRRDIYTPKLNEEFHLSERYSEESQKWESKSSKKFGPSFWNGNCVGGSTNFMAAYFYRLKPKDFRLKSEFGEVKGANVVDWPISYEELEPYYAKVESLVGVSGRVKKHPNLEPRSTSDFPFPPLAESIVSELIDKAAFDLGFNSLPVSRGIISKSLNKRSPCYYSNYCGSYGCSSGAKGSSRAALLNSAVETGNCRILTESQVYKLNSDKKKVTSISYYDKFGNSKKARAKQYVVACQAIETSRLLLNSSNSFHPNGIGNSSGQLGKNLLFSAGGSGGGELNVKDFSNEIAKKIMQPGLFINRGFQDWYYINDKSFGAKAKGGTIDFLFEHANPIRRASSAKWEGSRLLWGKELKRKLEDDFINKRHIRFEIFNDWLPTDNCYVSLGEKKDKWGSKVAKVRLGYHKHDLKVASYLEKQTLKIMEKLKLHNVYSSISPNPPTNLIAGGCRFGDNPKTSYLDRDCKAHFIDNLYVTDGSFMPTGGSVPYTWTIYANSFRVAEVIKGGV